MKRQLTLDEPLMIEGDRRVRVIVLVAEEPDPDPDDDSIESVREGIRQGWQEAMIGQTYPIAQLWVVPTKCWRWHSSKG